MAIHTMLETIYGRKDSIAPADAHNLRVNITYVAWIIVGSYARERAGSQMDEEPTNGFGNQPRQRPVQSINRFRWGF
jgi:hypothetical protein